MILWRLWLNPSHGIGSPQPREPNVHFTVTAALDQPTSRLLHRQRCQAKFCTLEFEPNLEIVVGGLLACMTVAPENLRLGACGTPNQKGLQLDINRFSWVNQNMHHSPDKWHDSGGRPSSSNRPATEVKEHRPISTHLTLPFRSLQKVRISSVSCISMKNGHTVLLFLWLIPLDLNGCISSKLTTTTM